MLAARLILLGLAAFTLVAACWLTGCGSGVKADSQSAGTQSPAGPPDTAATSAPVATAAKSKPAPPKAVDPVVVLHTSAGDIHVLLFREKAPQTVDNFLKNYAERQFYDGTIFHHVEAGSMIIGGGYTADLAPKETRSPIFNESQNRLLNKRGMVAMIRDPGNAHSATSQFFINLADNPLLDCQADLAQLTYPTDTSPGASPADTGQIEQAWGYCVFGQVIAGLDVIDRIGQTQVAAEGDFSKLPVERVAIQSIQRIR